MIVLWAPPAVALPPLAQTFAICSGQLSAEVTHAWVIGADSTPLEAQRAQFLAMLDAVVTEDMRPEALNLRIEAKVAHADLLSTISFSGDPARAVWASARATSQIEACGSMLLGQ